MTEDEIAFIKQAITSSDPFDSVKQAKLEMERIDTVLSEVLERKKLCQERIQTLTTRDNMISRINIYLNAI